MLLVGPIARPDERSNMEILGVSHYPTMAYENAVILISNDYFQKATSKIAKKIKYEFSYNSDLRFVEYSQLLLSLYLLIRELQSKNLKLNLTENIEQILEKKVIKKKTKKSPMLHSPYPKNSPYYNISPDVSLTYHDMGVYNPMRMLTGYQYTFITNKDTSEDKFTEKRAVNKYKSKSRLQTYFSLKANHIKLQDTNFVNHLIGLSTPLYHKQITKIGFLCITETYSYDDYYINRQRGFNIDFISFMELYKKEPLHHYGVFTINPSMEFVAWSDSVTDKAFNIGFYLAVTYKLIFDIFDKNDQLSYLKEYDFYKDFFVDKNELYNIIYESKHNKYIEHTTILYTYDTYYCCENFERVQRFEANQDLVIYMDIETRYWAVHHYILVSLPKYQKMFHKTRGNVKLIKELLLSAISAPNTNIRYKKHDSASYLIIS